MSTAPNLSTASWRKSSYSDGQGGSCLEVADGFHEVTPVRDSKAPHGPALLVPNGTWSAFVDAVKTGTIGPR